ncbi:BTAD domain-containing putative transcriptional regulator [Streptomyces sp. NPDC056479]|uniref:AfsR/SARP family transcriptional regulator n=1 Tax=Streptomyces sp. NPDC056479 TaxID=3345832 RepID=UPI0036AB625B
MMEASEQGELRFNVLGSLEGWSGSSRLRLGGAVQERVLATLLLEPGRMVPVSRLVESVWDDTPPPTAAHQVRKAVAHLRRRVPDGNDVIITDGPGYRASVDDTQLDLIEFGTHLGTAGRAVSEGRTTDAVTALRRAVALWRGPVLSGIGGSVIEAAATALEERRLTAAEQLLELRLGLGEAAELVVDLRDLIVQHPLRETLRGHLMLALYRSGRQAEALEEYQRVRALLADELGIDPGPQLTRLHEGILREAPELAAPEPPMPAPRAPAAPQSAALPAASASGSWTTAPCTLPYDLSDFTGRQKELSALLDCIKDKNDSAERHTPIVAIDGMGGSGKTSLAVRAARQMSDLFPDGQLHMDLRGFTPGERSVTPASALDSLLRALGIPGDRIPDDVEGRAALWRSTLADRRVLLLLDNAVDAAQVLPLLPPAPGSLVLVTSRARLLDLDGAEWISIGPMSHEDSALLLKEMLGEARVAAEPKAAAELVALCGRLPLALRIVAARLRNRPRWTVQYLADRLRDETRRLEELSAGERSVAATLRLSYQAMAEEYRTSFRVLGLHPGTDIDVHSTAALLEMDTHDAEDVLERLLDVHLLQQPDMGLYRFHDLVRNFARSQRGPATEQDDSAAVERLLGYYLTATEEACQVLFPGRKRSSTGIAVHAGELPPLQHPAQAAQWFDREHSSLLAAVVLADGHGLDRHTVCLTRNIVFQLNALGRFEDFRYLSQVAVSAARRVQDLALLGASLSSLGIACWKLGHFDEGIEVAGEGRDIAVRLGDKHTEAHSESTIGLLLTVLGQHADALPHLERAMTLERELDIPRAQAETLTILSTLYEQWGRYEEAASAARRALEIHGEVDYRNNQVMALTDLAFAHVGLGEYEDARACLERARGLCDESSPPGDFALVLALSAEVAQCLEGGSEVSGLTEHALELARTSGSPTRQAKVENLIGRFHRRRHEYDRAMALHAHAHELASAIRYRAEDARALYGMGCAAEALGDTASAAEHKAAAITLFDFMGSTPHGFG